MKIKNPDRIKKIISIIIFLFWIGLIFYFSNQASARSDASSNTIINILNNVFLKWHINLYNYPFVVVIVRKSAHIFSYFILSLITYNLFRVFKLSKLYLYTLIFSVLYAISDEIHQLFIPGRSSEIKDVLIDSIGIISGLLLIKWIRKRKNLQKS